MRKVSIVSELLWQLGRLFRLLIGRPRDARPPKFWVKTGIPFRGQLMPGMAGGAVEVRSDFGGVYLISGQTVDIANITAVAAVDTSITLAGVRANDIVVPIPPILLEAGVTIQGANVTAADTVSIRATNASAGAINPASSALWQFLVFRR